uniref:VOC domain-containing protein n=1 Tax=Rhizochromulina marina TaxID=1034831 RepID=A0A7S2WVZ7_9STRA|mmetsp:Transcript_7015/g.20272  ORF Transcript_7015/g.20272 Transcript_7015/m.20272 type:complete len:360 (+) Transcript_7015:24-1103(+)
MRGRVSLRALPLACTLLCLGHLPSSLALVPVTPGRARAPLVSRGSWTAGASQLRLGPRRRGLLATAQRPGVAGLAARVEGGQLLHAVYSVPDVKQAAEFYGDCFGMSTSRTNDAGDTFVSFGPDAGGAFFALKFVASAGEAPAGSVVTGAVLCVPDVEEALRRAEELGGEVVTPADTVSLLPSLVPDEPMDAPRTEVKRGVVQDPWGYRVELLEEAGRRDPVDAVVLSVADLDASISYYSDSLGMTLHRKRSLLPIETALTGRLSYQPSEADGAVVELRYNYASKDHHAGDATCHFAVAVPSVTDAVGQLDQDGAPVAEVVSGPGTPLTGVGEQVAIVQVIDGVRVALIDQLEALTAAI